MPLPPASGPHRGVMSLGKAKLSHKLGTVDGIDKLDIEFMVLCLPQPSKILGITSMYHHVQ